MESAKEATLLESSGTPVGVDTGGTPERQCSSNIHRPTATQGRDKVPRP